MCGPQEIISVARIFVLRVGRSPFGYNRTEMHMSFHNSTLDRILRWPEVKEQTGLSRTTAWREVRSGRFPSPVKLTDHAIGWRQSDLDAWLASRPKSA